MNISIVTGTLNRCNLLENLIKNTVGSDDRLELILVDGGSTDDTIKYIKGLNHPRIKLIEVGHRSSYPHFMNLGVKNASHELICQWNDDVLLVNKDGWQDVFDSIFDEYNAYLFYWTNDGICWNLLNEANKGGEIVLNYGIYRKDVFRKCGLYNTLYKYYCADGEMSLRAYCMGVRFLECWNARVRVLSVEKTAIHDTETSHLYYKSIKEYHNGNISMEGVELL